MSAAAVYRQRPAHWRDAGHIVVEDRGDAANNSFDRRDDLLCARHQSRRRVLQSGYRRRDSGRYGIGVLRRSLSEQ